MNLNNSELKDTAEKLAGILDELLTLDLGELKTKLNLLLDGGLLDSLSDDRLALLKRNLTSLDLTALRGLLATLGAIRSDLSCFLASPAEPVLAG